MEKRFFENWASRGVNSGVTQFHAQFTHISRQLVQKTKKNSLGKTVLKLWSQFCCKIGMSVHKVTLKKKCKKVKTHKT